MALDDDVTFRRALDDHVILRGGLDDNCAFKIAYDNVITFILDIFKKCTYPFLLEVDPFSLQNVEALYHSLSQYLKKLFFIILSQKAPVIFI